MIAFAIWTVVCLVFVFVGISCFRETKEVGFFQGVIPPKMKDVKAYNRAVGWLWITFAMVFWLIGIPLIFIEQNSPYAFIICILSVFLIIILILVYLRIVEKYRCS